MKLLVGLGNPGATYARTRHNIGFMAADELVRRYSLSDWKSRFKGQIAEGSLAGQRVLVLKPETYMNLSGESVLSACSFYKLTPQDIIVFHDDLDLKPGQLRVKTGGSAGGHNGLKSIDAHIGVDYMRVRIGIGRPVDKRTVADFVLGRFSPSEADLITPLIEDVVRCIDPLINGDSGRFLNEVALSRKGK